MKRGIVDDQKDWYKYFKCSSIDPSVLSGEVVHRIRSEEMRKMLLYKLARHPRQMVKLLARFVRHMPFRDVLHLIMEPFLGKKGGRRRRR